MKDIAARARALSDEMAGWRRHLHQNPEAGMELPATSDYVAQKLREMGISPRRIGGYSLVADLGGQRPGKVFLLRADMDALPLQEETGLPFSSQTADRMHACGHDLHAAMLLGAARILKEREDELEGTVRLFFQAAEETLEGARAAVEAGLLEGPDVDAAMMIHVSGNTHLPDGTLLAATDGPCYASADWYRVDAQGKGGHGAAPHTTISAINIITAINAGIQEIISVMTPASAHAVATVGQIHAGHTSNIIPDTAFLAGTIRTFDETLRGDIKAALIRLAEGAAAARGGSAAVTFTNTAPAVRNDPETSRALMAYAARALGEARVGRAEELEAAEGGKTSGSEDFAYIAQKVPSGVFWLSAGRTGEGYTFPGHHPKVNFSEGALWAGAAAYAAGAMGWLEEHR